MYITFVRYLGYLMLYTILAKLFWKCIDIMVFLRPHFYVSVMSFLYVIWLSLIIYIYFKCIFFFQNVLHFKTPIIEFIFIFLTRILMVSLWEPAKYTIFLKSSEIKLHMKEFILHFLHTCFSVLHEISAYTSESRKKHIRNYIFQTSPYGFLIIIGCICLAVESVIAREKHKFLLALKYEPNWELLTLEKSTYKRLNHWHSHSIIFLASWFLPCSID